MTYEDGCPNILFEPEEGSCAYADADHGDNDFEWECDGCNKCGQIGCGDCEWCEDFLNS